MPNITSRITRLERSSGVGRSRVIAIRSKGATEGEVSTFLETQNIGYDSRRDTVAHIILISAPADWAEIELLNVTEARR